MREHDTYILAKLQQIRKYDLICFHLPKFALFYIPHTRETRQNFCQMTSSYVMNFQTTLLKKYILKRNWNIISDCGQPLFLQWTLPDSRILQGKRSGDGSLAVEVYFHKEWENLFGELIVQLLLFV